MLPYVLCKNFWLLAPFLVCWFLIINSGSIFLKNFKMKGLFIKKKYGSLIFYQSSHSTCSLLNFYLELSLKILCTDQMKR